MCYLVWISVKRYAGNISVKKEMVAFLVVKVKNVSVSLLGFLQGIEKVSHCKAKL